MKLMSGNAVKTAVFDSQCARTHIGFYGIPGLKLLIKGMADPDFYLLAGLRLEDAVVFCGVIAVLVYA